MASLSATDVRFTNGPQNRDMESFIDEVRADPVAYYKQYINGRGTINMRYLCFIIGVGYGELSIDRAITAVEDWARNQGLD